MGSVVASGEYQCKCRGSPLVKDGIHENDDKKPAKKAIKSTMK